MISFKNKISNWLKTRLINDRILDDLLIDIDESKIQITKDGDYIFLNYEKNGVEYKIRVVEDSGGTEFGPSTRFSFFINCKYPGLYSSKKLRRLYNALEIKHNKFIKELKKYSL